MTVQEAKRRKRARRALRQWERSIAKARAAPLRLRAELGWDESGTWPAPSIPVIHYTGAKP